MTRRRPLTAAEKAQGRRLMAALGVPAAEIRETRTRLYWVDPATGDSGPGYAASELRAVPDDPDTLDLAGEPCVVRMRRGVVQIREGLEGDHGVAEVAQQLDSAGIRHDTPPTRAN